MTVFFPVSSGLIVTARAADVSEALCCLVCFSLNNCGQTETETVITGIIAYVSMNSNTLIALRECYVVCYAEVNRFVGAASCLFKNDLAGKLHFLNYTECSSYS